MVEKLINIIINEFNKHIKERSCLLAGHMFNQHTSNSVFSIPKHIVTTLLTILKNASKLLKENMQKLAIVLVFNLKVIMFDQYYSNLSHINVQYYLNFLYKGLLYI